MKRETQQALEWWNREDFNGSFEQQKLGLKYYPNGFDMDNEEQNIWEIWKKETQEYNETFNPEAHSSLIIDFDKAETIEEAAYDYTESIMFSHKSLETVTMAKRFDKCYITGAKSDAAKNHWFKIFQDEQNKQFKQQKS